MKRRAEGRSSALTARIGLTLAGLAAVYAGFLFALYEIGAHVDPDPLIGAPAIDAWVRGRVMVIVGLVLIGWQFMVSRKWMLTVAGARFVSREEAPGLHELVERLAALVDVALPRIAVSRSTVPNSFTVVAHYGRRRTALVVTQGLLDRLDQAELEAVLAHELTHIANRDAAVMGTVAPLVLFAGAMRHAKHALPRLLFFAVAAFYLPALLLLRGLSRCREYSADRGAAVITGTPEQLMSALVKLGAERERIPTADLRAIARFDVFCIISPFERLGVFADHPPLARRLEALERIARELGRPARSKPNRQLIRG